MDIRLRTLAENILLNSLKIKENEKLLIEVTGTECLKFVEVLIEIAYSLKAHPFIKITIPHIERALLINSNDVQLKIKSNWEYLQMCDVDAIIIIKDLNNLYEFSDIPKNKLSIYSSIMKKVHNVRVNNKRWLLLRYPSPSMAQIAGMSTYAFEKYFFDICNINYSKMNDAMDALIAYMSKVNTITIQSNDTDISFSIKNMPVIKCAGEFNLPDGEVFVAPVKNSVNGYIQYNTSSIFQGKLFNNIKLHFQNGKIIDIFGNNKKELEAIFATDDGASFIGEFAFGLNPFIKEPINDILFDEKISGSIHLTPGSSYQESYNGNDSSIHWDLIKIMRSEYGGGKIYFDDQLVYEDGLFLIDSLICLNAENLL